MVNTSSDMPSRYNQIQEIQEILLKNPDTNKENIDLPWIEKYRPRKLKGIVGQSKTIETLRNAIRTNNLPHMLFYGPPGSGKTSTILALAKELFGPKLYKERVIELNASDERGINIVRGKIKNAAKLLAENKEQGYLSPPYKIIILDEADAMTHEAQWALRKIMETYAGVTRFCIICNYVDQIIEPLLSRCARLRFSSLPKDSISKLLKKIAKKENFSNKLNNDAYARITELSDGDMRQAITGLQKCFYMPLTDSEKISVVNINESYGILTKSILENKLSEMKTLNAVIKLSKYIQAGGYNIKSVIENLAELTIMNDTIEDHNKSIICLKLSDIERKLNDGGNEHLQLMHALTTYYEVTII